jgi:hypothetical protein
MTVLNPTLGTKDLMGRLHSHDTLIHDLSAAAIAGQIAGLVMAVVVMLVFGLFLGKSPLYPVQVIGSLIFGEEALRGLHVPALLTGLILHQLGPSLFWGLVFGLGVYAFKLEGTIKLATLGLLVGIFSQAMDSNVLVPAAFQAMGSPDLWAREVPVAWSWAAHVVYGLCLAVYSEAERWLDRL